MPAAKRERLYGWGHSCAAECDSYRPEKLRDLHAVLRDHKGSLLARGLGRSYGDAPLPGDAVLRTERLNHVIEFDAANGILRAQAGVTLADVMEMGIPRGWLPPVVPGTRHITLGGAFAANVHGKNHWREGEFAEHVLSIRLALPGGETIECSPGEHGDTFWATAGGMGMTGIIEDLTLKLRPIATSSLKTTSFRVHSVEDMLGAFEAHRNSADYMIGWIDHTQRRGSDDGIGHGVFEAANHLLTGDGGAPLTGWKPPRNLLSVPVFMPPFLLNRWSIMLYNRYRFKKYTVARKSDTVGFSGFFHPLDGIGHWNRLYGRRGFFQYQCLIPEGGDTAGQIHGLLSAIHREKCAPFLTVLKYHREGKGFLTFSRRGYSLALDFPNTARVRGLLPQLDRRVAEGGGRVYLAKDALLTPGLFRAMYGHAAADWSDIVCDLDPMSRFTSLMSQRLEWKRPH